MAKQTFRLVPLTSLGKWSIGLIIAMPLLLILGSLFLNTMYVSVPSGNTLLDDIAGRPGLALSMLAGMVAGVAAFFTGLLAIIRQKERALLVFISSIIGALVIILLASEVLFPQM